MRKITATAGSAVFLVIAPGVVAGLMPPWLTGWQPGGDWPVPVRITGAVLTGAGAVVLLGAFAQFAIQGQGTPAPPAPTKQLVVRGLYRYVRNPMYLAVLAVITGQALLLSRPVLLGYTRHRGRRRHCVRLRV
jgi:protein-S-isoprenylcysteine O-methyltransferase Ste14